MENTPKHLGIIIDGNRRWAKERGLPVFEGHRRGLEKVKKTVDWSKERGIKILTMFIFSTENWKREKREVNYLMKLAELTIASSIKKLHKTGIKVKIIGQKEKLPRVLREKIREAEKLTENNKEMTLNFALSYGGRAEITEAVKNIIKEKVPAENITEDLISQNLWTSDLDMLVRSGKEQRLSNFLIWQAAYSEIYFLKKYWPDFEKEDLDEILKEYARRQRRFGK